jgi:hypothetical protein
MPLQRNYNQDITPFLNGDAIEIGKSVFRLATPDDNIISAVIGDNEIGLDDARENLELHLYDMNTNALVKSVYIPLNERHLYVRNESYNDYIQLGLELWNPERSEDSILIKYLSEVPSGFYTVVINFFSDEIGSANTREWKIKQISPSRSEIIIEPLGELNQIDFQQFVYDSIFVTDFDALLRVIFNRDGQNIDFYSDFKQQFVRRVTGEGKIYLEAQNDAYKNRLNSALDRVFGEIFTQLEQRSRQEREANRFRITRQGFNASVIEITRQVVGNNISEFPEGGIVMRNT